MFSEAAIRQLVQIEKGRRGLVKIGIRKHLAQSDPSQGATNKFRLRRASAHAEYELRLGPWRVFYRVRGRLVEVVLIGEKKGNRLLIGGEEFVL